MSSTSPSRRPLAAVVLVAITALVVYFAVSLDPDADEHVAPATATAPVAEQPAPRPLVAAVGSAPQEGFVEAGSNRLMSVAGTPMPDTPLPQARPIPVKARTGEVVGFSLDANGNARPMRAGQLQAVPNTPGTFATVDMWAEGGPAVVPATRNHPVSPELAARIARDDARGDGH